MGALLLIGAGLAVLHLFGAPVCVFHRVTGLPCLTCGSTRAAALALAGEPLAAFLQQPLAVAVGAAAGAWFVSDALCLFALGRTLRVSLAPREGRLLVLGGLALALANWAYLVWRGV